MAEHSQSTPRTVRKVVGRSFELEVLRAALDSARRGRPVVVLCVGEPGIGKTRLAEAISAAADADGFTPAWGSGEDADGAPPYWPWLRILRQLDQRTGADGGVRDAVAAARDALSGAGARQVDAEGRFQQFEAVAEALRKAAAAGPTLIVLDDAHSMDEPSALLLRHVTRDLHDERLCLMVTAREADPRVRSLATDLLRSPFTREIHLRGLDTAGVREYLVVAGLPAGDADSERARELTGGNPLFLAQLARTGFRGGLSQTVRETIARRVQALPPRTVQILGAAAILGRDFACAELAELVGVPPTLIQERIDELESAGLITTAGTGSYRFVHALVRDAVESGLVSAERAALHQAAARIAEARPGADLFAVAHHLAEAAGDGDTAAALVAVRQAADEAMRRLAFEPAARLYRVALSIGADLDLGEQFHLLLQLQRACHDAGQLGDRLDAATRAASLARQLGRPELLAKVALAMPPVGHIGFDLATRRLCAEALDLVDESDVRLRAMLLACFAETFNYRADAVAGRRASRAALELAEASGDPAAIMAACRSFQVLFAGPDDLDTRAGIAHRMLTLAEATEDTGYEVTARAAWITVLLERGDLDSVADQIAASAGPVEGIDTPSVRSRWLWAQATLAQARGQVNETRRLAAAAHAAAGPTELPSARHGRAAVLGNLARHAGQDDTTLSATRDSAAPNPGGAPPIIAGIALAHSLMMAGRRGEAADTYRALGPVTQWRPAPHVELLCAAFGVAVASELSFVQDLPVFVDRLAPYRGHHVVSGIGAIAYFGPVELWLGLAARHLSNLEGAINDLDAAVQLCARNGAVGFQADAEIELAAALIGRAAPGDATRASRLLAHVVRVAETHAMPALRSRADALRSGDPKGPLTRREREVATLVAAGLTNRQIGERLVLSERTAQNHVQHILDKLGVNTRAAIATWVAENRSE